jgi:two-component system, chemotaxis family, protein-glutamate methylesterase/glutaminase
MAKIRVLVVDDAVVIRRMVSGELSNDPALEVVGTAANGRIALTMMNQVSPDVVILDVEMPELDGLGTLKELRKTWPRVPVIMFSALTERGAEATLDALALGATAYFTKPAKTGETEAALAIIRERLAPMVKAIGTRALEQKGATTAAGQSMLAGSASVPGAPIPAAGEAHPTAGGATGTQPPHVRRATVPVEVLAIGTSTGGPNALADLFEALPGQLTVPILIVQHMPPMFTRLLAERLTAKYAIPVKEAVPGTKLEPGVAWIAPGDYHMTVSREGLQASLRLNQDPPENSCRPAVDVLLRSVAKTYGPATLAVILTGMGQDGLRGCEAVREAGGQILVQDEATSVVWGMPGHVARAGLADRVLPLAAIADEIVRRLNQNIPVSRQP